jgi:hypothetical protein
MLVLIAYSVYKDPSEDLAPGKAKGAVSTIHV